jgi:hypothetical protein
MPGLNLNPVTAAAQAVGSTVEKVAGVFTSNAEKDAQRSADEQMALLKAYQAEFHAREKRTWIDAIADSFNRLIRPFIVTIIICIFLIAYISPERFALITTALGSVPDGYWALLSVIIAFYFGGRMQLKSQDFKFKAAQADAVKALIETKKAFRKLEMDDDEPDKLAGDNAAKSDAVNQLRSGQRNRVLDTYLAVPETERAAALKKTVSNIKNVAEEDAFEWGDPLDIA